MAANMMRTNTNGGAAATPADDKWDEARYEESLKHLHEMHLKLRKLRSTIPRMIAPAMELGPSKPETIFAAFQHSMTAGVKDVKEFREAWTGEATTTVLDKAKQSRLKNPLGIKPWQPRNDPNWTNMDVD